MAINVPKYNDLYNSLISDLKNKLGLSNIIGKSVISLIASVFAAKQKLLYSVLTVVNKNIYPDLADEETLRRFGRIRLGRDIKPAVSGIYKATITGEIGAIVPISTSYSDRNGYLYITDSISAFSSTSLEITLRALTPGTESILSVDSELHCTTPLTNIDSFAVVSEVVTQPTNSETIEEYRKNVVDSYRLMPQGGSRADYRVWTESVPGVREVYPYAKSGSVGEINLYVEAFPDDSEDGNGTPFAATLTAVENAIEPDKIPLTVYNINYLAVNTIPIDIDIENISDASKLTKIKAAMETFLYEKRPFVAGADILRDVNKGRIYASEIFQIVLDTGVSFDDIVCERDGTPFTVTEFTGGDIPYINDVTKS